MAAIHEDFTPTASTRAAMTRPRLDSIDIVRGIVMVLMALDHVKHYFCRPDFAFDPMDLTKETNWALFLTRWVTHFCAPTFVFLAGTSAFLFGTRGKTKGELAWFLLSRGLWLILIDLTIVPWSWAFRIDYSHGFGGGIIFVIGVCLVVLSGLIWLPVAAITTIGVALIAFHNLLDGKSAENVGLPSWLWSLLHDGGPFAIVPGVPGLLSDPQSETKYRVLLQFMTPYRLLAWIGIVAAGYGFGTLFLLDRPVRRQQLLGLGITLTLLFVGLRLTNYYGDRRFPPNAPNMTNEGQPGPWKHYQKKDGSGTDWEFTILSFLNTQKYPPSLLFILMTLGPAIMAIGLFDREITGPITRFFIVFGRVPFFFYLIHIPLIHALAFAVDRFRFGQSPVANDGPWAVAGALKKHPEIYPADSYGFSLVETYLIWVIVVLLLYPLCWWFGRVKQRYRSSWLSYL